LVITFICVYRAKVITGSLEEKLREGLLSLPKEKTEN